MHLTLRGVGDGVACAGCSELAIDEVFANGNRNNQPAVPASLNPVKLGLYFATKSIVSGSTGAHGVQAVRQTLRAGQR
jgi:hypothetical protein